MFILFPSRNLENWNSEKADIKCNLLLVMEVSGRVLNEDTP